MARLVVTIRAARDVAAIVAMLTDNAGADVAIRYRRNIDTLYDRLSLFPRSGARRPSLGRDIRIGAVEPYVVIYEYRPDTVRVLRVIDGRRNVTRRLVRE
jgi:toxin ParE1/3/4